jgi:hypothetical protein
MLICRKVSWNAGGVMAMNRFTPVALPIALSMIAAATTAGISGAQSVGMDPGQSIGEQSPPSNSSTTAQNVEPAGPMEGLMHSIQTLPHDLVEIPCATHL